MTSLARRLLLWLTIIQFAAILTGMLLFPLFAPFTSYSELAELTARDRLEGCLRRSADGQIAFAPTPEWLNYKARRPSLAYAISDVKTGSVIASSADDLAEIARTVVKYPPRDEGSLTTERHRGTGDTVVIVANTTDVGHVLFVTAGNSFHSDDIASFFAAFSPAMLPLYAPIIAGALLAVPLFVRRTLAPLDRLAAQAQAIDVTNTRERLTETDIDTAFVPLIASINAALDRLDKGFGRQRLYSANAAHELRTPLAILRARLEVLPETELKNELQLDAVRIQSLVEQLLSIARLGQADSGSFDHFDLVDVAREVVADRAPLALRGKKFLSLEAAETVVILGNQKSVQSAIANVIDNALRSEPIGGTVNVSVDNQGTVSVADHGRGIDIEDREAIFEPFWRKDERPPGSGLGLAIVKEVVALHGGAVEVGGTRGGGATFRLSFPILSNQI